MIKVSPWVTHECLDNEVIAINLETGAYFVLEGAAAECWTSVVSGATADGVAQRLTDLYDVSEQQARADASSVLAELQQSGMLIEEDGERSPEPVVTGAKLAYAAPIVQKYDDLEDLLLIDPIHEVDDTGWPVARTD